MSLFALSKKTPTLFWCMIIAFVTVMAVPADAFGQRSRGGGGSRSKPRATQPKPKPKPSSTRTNNAKPKQKADANKSNNRGWGSSNRNSNSRTTTKADKALHNRAKQQGTHFSNRQQATTAFKTKKGAELRQKNPVRFSSEPTTRPSYVPQTYSTGGNTYNISYNAGYGGYGYMNALGTWVMYDIMWNQAFVNNQMRSYGYAYGPAPSSGIGAGAVIGIILGVVVIGGVVFFVVSSGSNENRTAA